MQKEVPWNFSTPRSPLESTSELSKFSGGLVFSLASIEIFKLFRSDEFDWLRHSEREAADQHCCHGDLGRVEEEIVRQEVVMIMYWPQYAICN